MTTLREAATAALEALENFGMKHYENTGEVLHRGVYEALKAALAEDALQRFTDVNQEIEAALAEPVEPVAWLWQHRETGRTRVLMPDERTATDVAAAWDVVGPLYLAPPQRPAEPVQEPVAWMDPHSGEVCRAHWLESHASERDVDRFSCPLYTAPPQRLPLSKEEMMNEFCKTPGIHQFVSAFFAGARYAERAHGIGGKDD